MFSQRLSDLHAALANCAYSDAKGPVSELAALQLFYEYLFQAHQNHGVIYVIGNGGSAGIASHFSNDLMKALRIASHTLYDSNLLTCISNDLGYEQVFSYPLERLVRQNDVLVAISSSGQSPNILRATDVCACRSIPIITLSGFQRDNPLRMRGALNFWIDRMDYGLVEASHFFLLHTVIDLWHRMPQPLEVHA